MKRPNNAVPTLTINEFLNQIQKESPLSILEKCSVVNESPIWPPRALPSENAMSMIQINGTTVIATKCRSVMCVEVSSNFLANCAFRINPNSIAESESFLEVHTVTGRPDNQYNANPEGMSDQQ